MRTRRAFTLIELLVVIAIISLLVSILLPSLNRAKDLARTVACTSNCRILGMAFVFYMEENTHYPPVGAKRIDPVSGSEFVVAWFALFGDILTGYGNVENYGRGDFLICPEAPEFHQAYYSKLGYGYNAKTFALARGSPQHNPSPADPTNMAYVTRDMVIRPEETVLLGDGSFGHYIPPTKHATYAIDCMSMVYTHWDSARDLAPTMRHRDWTTANIGYADGHAGADGTCDPDLWPGSDAGLLAQYQEHWVLDPSFHYPAW